MVPEVFLAVLEGPAAPWFKRPEVAYPVAITAVSLLAVIIIVGPKVAAYFRARGKQGVLDPLQAEEMLLTNAPLILDIRDEAEFKGKLGHLRGALSMPFLEVRLRFEEFRTKEPRPIIVVDDTDKRAYLIAEFLRMKGYTWVYVLKGGIRAWKRDRMPLYH